MARWALVSIIVAATLLALAGLATAQPCGGIKIWVDRNGDGQPDTLAAGTTNLGQTITFDVWVDMNAFTFTAFNIFTKWGVYGGPPPTFENSVAFFDTTDSQITVVKDIGSGSLDPFDSYSNPSALGVAVSGISPAATGIQKLYTVTLKTAFAGTISDTACVTPLIDQADPFNTFSQIFNNVAGTYCLFEGAVVRGSCYSINPGPAAREETTWGKLKGLYR